MNDTERERQQMLQMMQVLQQSGTLVDVERLWEYVNQHYRFIKTGQQCTEAAVKDLLED